MISATTLPTASANGIGLVATTQNFAIGDRGCLPSIGTSAQLQSQTQTLILAAGTGTLTGTGIWTDYGAYLTLLCSTSGTCCASSLCNSALIYKFNGYFGFLFWFILEFLNY